MQKSIVAIGLLLNVGAASASSNAKVAPTVGTNGIGLHYPYNPRVYMLQSIIKLLTEMETERTAEDKQDEIMKQNQDCWCTETEKEATMMESSSATEQEAADAAAHDAELAKNRSMAEIMVIDGKIGDANAKLGEATATRDGETGVFQYQERNLLNAISTIRKAMEYLEKVMGTANSNKIASLEVNEQPAFLQNMRSVLATVHVAPEHAGPIAAFLQAEPKQANWPGKGYTVQTGSVFNALTAVLESSQTELASLRAVEALQKEKYDTFKAAMDGMIDEWKKQKAEKQVAMATAGTSASTNSLASYAARTEKGYYQEFKRNLKIKCDLWGEQYAYRVKNRADELASIQNCISMLTDIKSHEASVKAFNPLSFHTLHPYITKQTASLLQTSHQDTSSRQAQAAAVLDRASKARSNTKIRALAAKVGAVGSAEEALASVRVSLKKMIEELKAEQEEETAHVHFCHAEIGSNSLATLSKSNELADIGVMKVGHAQTMTNADSEVETLNIRNAEETKLLDSAASLRGKQSAEFAIMKKDMTEMIDILTSGMTALTRFYGNYKDGYKTMKDYEQKSELVEDPTTGDKKKTIIEQGYDKDFMEGVTGSKADPGTVGRYSPSKRAGGAIALLGSIAKKCERNLRELADDERRAEDTFKIFKQKTTQEIVANNLLVEQFQAERAAAADDSAIAERAAGDIQMELNQLKTYKEDLDSSCAWYIKNYATRQNARSLEIWGLMQASNILSGQKGVASTPER